MRVSNHPPKGSHITADPIRSERDIKNIKKLLADHPRNSCLWNFSINVNLRCSDVLNVKIGDVTSRRYSVVGERSSKCR